MGMSAAKLQVAGIEPESIVDGPGIRFAVFVQGCPHKCPGCHNPGTHPFQGGSAMDIEEVFAQFRHNPLLKGITLSGGEPFCQAGPLAELARLVHSACKDVVVYTGYTYEELAASEDPAVQSLLSETDLLIDGPFIEEQKDLDLLFRGSENQRLIDMKRTRARGQVVLWEQ
jgi:anaerobic ribonucleoside-triphosphate reductase activating protein